MRSSCLDDLVLAFTHVLFLTRKISALGRWRCCENCSVWRLQVVIRRRCKGKYSIGYWWKNQNNVTYVTEANAMFPSHLLKKQNCAGNWFDAVRSSFLIVSEQIIKSWPSWLMSTISAFGTLFFFVPLLWRLRILPANFWRLFWRLAAQPAFYFPVTNIEPAFIWCLLAFALYVECKINCALHFIQLAAPGLFCSTAFGWYFVSFKVSF